MMHGRICMKWQSNFPNKLLKVEAETLDEQREIERVVEIYDNY